MKRHLFLYTLVTLWLYLPLLAQNKPSLIIQSPYKKEAPSTTTHGTAEQTSVQAVIDGLFLGMYNADTAAVSRLFVPNAKLTSTTYNLLKSIKFLGNTCITLIFIGSMIDTNGKSRLPRIF